MQLRSSSKSLLPAEQANFHHLVMDIAWFGLALPAIVRFLSVYAIRLGATPIELGWLVSLPALVLLLSAGLGGWWRSHYSNSTHALFWPSLGFRFIFLLPALTPFLPREWQPTWLILSETIPALPQGISSVIFLVMMREAIDAKQMTSLLSRRNLSLNVAVGLSGLAFGFWLEQAPFPLNYQVMFLLAFLLTLGSQCHLTKIRVMPVPVTRPAYNSSNPWRSPKFLRAAFVAAVTHLAFFCVFPLIPLRLVNDLGASESFMALFALCELTAGAMISLAAPRIVSKMGNRKMIALSMIGTALSAVVVSLAHHQAVTLLAAMFSGASWTLAGMGIFGFFTENTPSDELTRYTTAYHQVVFFAMFVGPLVGSGMANEGVNLPIILLAGAGVRLLAGIFTEYDMLERVSRLSHHAPWLVRVGK
jgi:MFS family permease